MFVLGGAIELLGFLAVAVMLAVGKRGSQRLLALVPVGTTIPIIAFAPGGPLMFAAWLGAALWALAFRLRQVAEPLPS